MDIVRDLSYNKNTAHSGNLPEGNEPGRETMQKKKEKKLSDRAWQAGLIFALLMLLCGCTKKEELLLLNGENAAERSEERDVFSEDFGEQAAPESEVLCDTAKERGHVQDGESQGARAVSGEASMQTDVITANPGVIYVHVCGAVANPGVYELESGCRVYEAVQAAGGFTECAEQNYVNQAQALADGVKLVIPTKEEAAAAGKAQDGTSEKDGALQDSVEKGKGIVGGAAQEGAEKPLGIVGGTASGGPSGADGVSDRRVNINTASETELCEIPGVGATRAAAIAAYRESHGAFERPEDIMRVNGIKEGMYEKIKDSIRVN